MKDDYVGTAYKYANSESAAVKCLAPGKKDKDGWINKAKGVRIKILSTTETKE
jgi:hypothetical protein